VKSLLPSPHDKRLLTRGAVAIAFIWGSGRLVPWWIDTRRDAVEREFEVHGQMVRARTMTTRAASVRDSLVRQESQFRWVMSRLIIAATPGAGSAQLASLVTTAAEESGVRGGTLQTDADTVRVGSFGRAAVRIELTGDINGVMEFLRRLETDSLLLRIRALTLSQSDPSADDSKPEVLRADIRVEALFRQRSP
jgi:hypothetical protein